MRERQKGRDKSKNSAPDKGGVKNEMLKHLDNGTLKILLKLFNK